MYTRYNTHNNIEAINLVAFHSYLQRKTVSSVKAS